MRHLQVMALALSLGAAAGAGADEVILKNGGRLLGEIREQRPDAVVVETGPGLVTVPMSSVARVVTTTSSLSTYRARAARLRSNDAEGWFELALWASAEGLNTQARQALAQVLAINPNHAGAHQASGHLLQDGRWMTPEESYRARGFVPFEGAWVSPAEREAIVTERAAAIEERRLRAEADARVREAEARARVAEAEAQRALLDSQAATEAGGIPYPWVLGGGGVVVGGAPILVNGQDPNQGLDPQPIVVPPPAPRPRPQPIRDRGASGPRSNDAGSRANERGSHPNGAGPNRQR
jgi:hypothetical protein